MEFGTKTSVLSLQTENILFKKWLELTHQKSKWSIQLFCPLSYCLSFPSIRLFSIYLQCTKVITYVVIWCTTMEEATQTSSIFISTICLIWKSYSKVQKIKLLLVITIWLHVILLAVKSLASLPVKLFVRNICKLWELTGIFTESTLLLWNIGLIGCTRYLTIIMKS